MVVCVAVVARDNRPLYLRSAQPSVSDGGPLGFHYLVHSSLDVMEEKLASLSSTPGGTGAGPRATAAATAAGAAGGAGVDLRELYLGSLYNTEDHSVYGYVTNTRVKFVLIVAAASNMTLRDNEVRLMFRRIHSAYVDLVSSPFYTPDEKIVSRQFEDVIVSLMTQE